MRQELKALGNATAATLKDPATWIGILAACGVIGDMMTGYQIASFLGTYWGHAAILGAALVSMGIGAFLGNVRRGQLDRASRERDDEVMERLAAVEAVKGRLENLEYFLYVDRSVPYLERIKSDLLSETEKLISEAPSRLGNTAKLVTDIKRQRREWDSKLTEIEAGTTAIIGRDYSFATARQFVEAMSGPSQRYVERICDLPHEAARNELLELAKWPTSFGESVFPSHTEVLQQAQGRANAAVRKQIALVATAANPAPLAPPDTGAGR